MTSRAGPPSPRNEPLKLPQLERNAAFAEWLARELQGASTAERAFAKLVFEAGWEARKKVLAS